MRPPVLLLLPLLLFATSPPLLAFPVSLAGLRCPVRQLLSVLLLLLQLVLLVLLPLAVQVLPLAVPVPQLLQLYPSCLFASDVFAIVLLWELRLCLWPRRTLAT